MLLLVAPENEYITRYIRDQSPTFTARETPKLA